MVEYIKDKLQLLIEDNVYLVKKHKSVTSILKKAEIEISKNINELNDDVVKTETITSNHMEGSKNDDVKEDKNNTTETNKVDETNILNDKKIPPKYKKLFRKVVLKTHPDKHPPNISEEEKLNYLNIYHNIIKDFEDEKYYSVLKYAISLNIEIDLEEFSTEIGTIKENNKFLESEIKKLQNNLLWDYYMTEDGDIKEKKLKKIVSKLRNSISR